MVRLNSKLGAVVVAGVAAVVSARPADPAIGPATLRQPLEEGMADVGELARSLLVTPQDLRIGSDFEHVYQADNGKFFRQQGGLIATFSRSEYVATRTGAMPVVPAGTVFSIGQPVEFKPTKRSHPEPIDQDAAPMNRSAPTDGLVSRSVSVPVSRAVSSPLPIGPIAAPVTQRTLATTEGAVTAPNEPKQDRKLDVSNEYYRRYRLQQISTKYGSAGE